MSIASINGKKKMKSITREIATIRTTLVKYVEKLRDNILQDYKTAMKFRPLLFSPTAMHFEIFTALKTLQTMSYFDIESVKITGGKDTVVDEQYRKMLHHFQSCIGNLNLWHAARKGYKVKKLLIDERNYTWPPKNQSENQQQNQLQQSEDSKNETQ